MVKKLPLILLMLLFTATSTLLSQESYYDDVNLNLTGLSLKNALAVKIINTHTNALDYTPGVWQASKVTDVNPTNSSQVLLIYGYTPSGTTSRTRGIDDNGGNNGEWNREHVFANSLGSPDLDSGGRNGPPYADAHNLRPSDTQINSSRGNKKFAAGSGTNSGAVSNGWYPGDEWKGDVARIVMYMYLRYGNQCKPTFVGVGNSSVTPDDMIDLFLQWNAEDPVSDIEKQRNPFHENTSNTYAQGNRNPFIDNPRLATRIWGGPDAEDIWGIYSSSDTEAPTMPTNLTASNITTSTIDVTWNASTDNTAVTSYDVFVNGVITNTSNTSITLNNLNSNTTYSISVLAKDAVNNKSPQTNPITPKTLEDTEAPTIPLNLVVSNETNTTFKVSWDASTDNTSVTEYEIYIDGSLNNATSMTTYTVTNLNALTTYSVQVLAKDAVGNKSALSTAINATTTDGSTSSANELFFSEYVEGSSNNKAIEIANVTSTPIDLSPYSIKRNGNGGATWSAPLNLSGTIAAQDVYVIINGSASLQKLIDEADLIHPNNSGTNNGEPINFNGNDPVGLFKNDVLIDIIGEFNGGSSNFAKDKTLRRKLSVVSPNTAFDLINEWEEFAKDNVDNIGEHNTATAGVNTEILSGISIFPNPVIDKKISISNTTNATINKITIHTIEGKEVFSISNSLIKEIIPIDSLKTGIYFLKIDSNLGSIYRKILVK